MTRIVKYQPIEHKEQRVVTTEQLAEVYETTSKNISNNFNNNREHFIEGKHFYCLEGEELRVFKNDSYDIGIAKNVNKLYLWTERGASRHSKILDTDKAWEQFDNLEETYFRVKNGQVKQLSAKEQLRLQYQVIEEHDERISGIEDEIKIIRETATLSPGQCEMVTEKYKSKITSLLGGKSSQAYKDRSLRAQVFYDFHRSIKTEFGVKYKNILVKNLNNLLEFIDDWKPAEYLFRSIKSFNTIAGA